MRRLPRPLSLPAAPNLNVINNGLSIQTWLSTSHSYKSAWFLLRNPFMKTRSPPQLHQRPKLVLVLSTRSYLTVAADVEALVSEGVLQRVLNHDSATAMLYPVDDSLPALQPGAALVEYFLGTPLPDSLTDLQVGRCVCVWRGGLLA